MIYVTGDTHSDFSRFSTRSFPEQKGMGRGDFLIICGDFGGIWVDSPEERYWLDWLNKKPFTTLFVCGNHENFDRLNSLPVVDFHGGKAHKVRSHIFHLMRGYVFELDGKSFFAFGGASSHDIKDGILEPSDYPSIQGCIKDYKRRTLYGQDLRINHLSWWKEELPSQEEMNRGRESLRKCGNRVDFVVSHCLPQSVVEELGFEGDILTRYFQSLIDDGLEFGEWHSGHYHLDRQMDGGFHVHYGEIERLRDLEPEIDAERIL